MQETYTTLAGRVLDLSGLAPDERHFLERCLTAYRGGMDWTTFCQLTEGSENPLMRATGGWVTRELMQHPLYQALTDLEGRLAIREGAPVGPEERPERDPLAGPWLTVAERAER